MAIRRIRGEWWIDVRVAGVRRRMKSPEQNRQDALAFQAQAVQDLRSRAVRAGALGLGKSFRDVAAFAPEWIELYARPRNKPSEIRNKQRYLRHDLLPFFGAMTLESVTSQRIAQFIAVKRKQGLTQKSVNNVLMTLSKMLRSAEEWGVIARAPKIRFFRTPLGRFRFLEPYESARLLAAAPSPLWRAMLMLGLRTGLRISELVALTWENIDLARRTVHVRQALVLGVLGTPKNGRERQVPLTNDALSALVALGPSTGWVFKRQDGRVIDSDVARRMLYKMCDAAGLERFGWHTLRHSFATQLVGLNAPIRNVQEMLGHASLEMTMRYSHVSAHALEATAAMLDNLEGRQLRIVPPHGHRSGHQSELLIDKDEGSAPSTSRTKAKTPHGGETLSLVRAEGVETPPERAQFSST